jgi:hypothetical protein
MPVLLHVGPRIVGLILDLGLVLGLVLGLTVRIRLLALVVEARRWLAAVQLGPSLRTRWSVGHDMLLTPHGS